MTSFHKSISGSSYPINQGKHKQDIKIGEKKDSQSSKCFR